MVVSPTEHCQCQIRFVKNTFNDISSSSKTMFFKVRAL